MKCGLAPVFGERRWTRVGFEAVAGVFFRNQDNAEVDLEHHFFEIGGKGCQVYSGSVLRKQEAIPLVEIGAPAGRAGRSGGVGRQVASALSKAREMD